MTLGNRLNNLRVLFKKNAVDGYIVPRTDEHQGEYVAPYRDRLRYLTHFSGSAGMAAILTDHAGLFVDGRYTLQAAIETDTTLYTVVPSMDISIGDWISDHVGTGAIIGYDPWLLTANDVARLNGALKSKNITLKPLSDNLVDAIWTDQPDAPMGRVVPHDDKYAGESVPEKLKRIGALIQQKGADAAVITTSESVNWLFNIRGNDVPCVPAALSYAVLNADGSAHLFIRTGKLSNDARRHLVSVGKIQIGEEDDLVSHLKNIGTAKKTVLFDAAMAPIYLQDIFASNGGVVMHAEEITFRPKAVKNIGEINGTRSAHIRDGVALISFFAGIELAHGKRPLTELDLVDRLESWRKKSDLYRGPSFPTISGSGPNGAIIHYRVSADSNRTLQDGDIILVDSGGQYLDGTTDVTRTFFLKGKTGGAPTPEQRDLFTRVLKGHIALGSARFPFGTTGSQLDAFARGALWQVGCDYAHGTGHGVGSYLSVHEGPQRISNAPNTVALEPGMIVSNEPGYYRAGEFGIRIENLVIVCESKGSRDERPMLCFDTLTLCPIDRALIDVELLSAAEIEWLNAYHKQVWDVLSPLVSGDVQAWLAAQTTALI